MDDNSQRKNSFKFIIQRGGLGERWGMHLSCVSWWEWTKGKYSNNLFIYKHCIVIACIDL